MNDEKPKAKPKAAPKPLPPAKPVREKTQAYKTFTQEDIQYDERAESAIDFDVSIYAKVALNNAEADAPRFNSQSESASKEPELAQKPVLSAGEPDPDNWF